MDRADGDEGTGHWVLGGIVQVMEVMNACVQMLLNLNRIKLICAQFQFHFFTHDRLTLEEVFNLESKSRWKKNYLKNIYVYIFFI